MENTALKPGSSISTEDILETLDRFGLPPKTINPDTNNEEVSDPLNARSLSEKRNPADELGSVVASGVIGGDIDVDGGQSIEKDWNSLFGLEWFYSKLRQQALEGKLKHFKFRSICWKVFLECLPENTDEWVTKATQLRQEYASFKEKCLVDPSKASEDADLALNNPLSQNENSLWKQYFQDNELKATINQDLDRLCPEVEFFQQSRIRQTMLNILFCHAKKNEALSYKQGMHELLGPIVYVLDEDSKLHRSFEDTNLMIAQVVLDPQWLEHDAYSLFSQLMDRTETWFLEVRVQRPTQRNKLLDPHAEPFAQETEPSTAIVKKLNRIQDFMLRKHDTELWLHMRNLGIAPQVYGLRWIRLLFGREFCIDDLLVLWDALFADGPLLDLVDYVYIAMLESIREKLLQGAYSTCISHLMKFPRVYRDVYRYVKEALSIRSMKTSTLTLNEETRHSSVPSLSAGTFPRAKQIIGTRRPPSAISTFTKRYMPSKEAGRQPEPTRATRQAQDGGLRGPAAGPLVCEDNPSELVPRNARSARPASVPIPEAKDRADSGSLGSSPVRAMKAFGTKLSKPRTRSRLEQEELQKDHERLQKRVSELNTDVDKIQGMLIYYGRKMDSYIGLLQEEILKDESTSDQDIIYLSLAGLKQIRDMLKGSEAFRGSTTEHDCDFMDIDNGIASRLQISSSELANQQKDLPENIPVPLLGDFGHFQEGNEKESSFMFRQPAESGGDAGSTAGETICGEPETEPESWRATDVRGDQIGVASMKGSINDGGVRDMWVQNEVKLGECSAFKRVGSSPGGNGESLVHPLSVGNGGAEQARDEFSGTSPPEHAQEFVFVNRDGTTQKLSNRAEHPLENSADNP